MNLAQSSLSPLLKPCFHALGWVKNGAADLNARWTDAENLPAVSRPFRDRTARNGLTELLLAQVVSERVLCRHIVAETVSERQYLNDITT